jgi:hypothetical protein
MKNFEEFCNYVVKVEINDKLWEQFRKPTSF